MSKSSLKGRLCHRIQEKVLFKNNSNLLWYWHSNSYWLAMSEVLSCCTHSIGRCIGRSKKACFFEENIVQDETKISLTVVFGATGYVEFIEDLDNKSFSRIRCINQKILPRNSFVLSIRNHVISCNRLPIVSVAGWQNSILNYDCRENLCNNTHSKICPQNIYLNYPS